MRKQIEVTNFKKDLQKFLALPSAHEDPALNTEGDEGWKDIQKMARTVLQTLEWVEHQENFVDAFAILIHEWIKRKEPDA